MSPEAVEEMLQHDRIEWEALAEILDAHPDEPLHDEGAAWTSRDVYAHMARWIEHSTGNLEAVLAGLPPSDIAETDEMNDRWQREDSRLSLNEARGWAHEAFARRIRVIESVPTDQWTEAIETIARLDGSEHYAAHRAWIKPSPKQS